MKNIAKMHHSKGEKEMTPKERLARIKTVIKGGGVYRDYTDSTQAFNNDIIVVEQALTELERLKKFKETFDNYELAKKQDFIAYENWLECEAELKKLPTKLLDEVYANYILQLNARIKINKKIIEENFDLNPSLCHDLEVENTALEFALMLIEGENTMSKSIYEEALETLNKYRNQNYNSANKDEVELANAINVILPKYVKQEKLLGLYKKLNEVCKELITLARYNSWSWYLDSEIIDIQKQIKEIEK